MLGRLCLFATLTATAAAPAARAQSAEACFVLVKTEGEMRMERANGYFVTGASLPLQPPAGHANVNAISCERPQLTFGDNDFRAPLDLDLPMYVQSGGRAVAIELVGGSFRVRVVQGNLTESEWAELRSALQRANTLLKASSG